MEQKTSGSEFQISDIIKMFKGKGKKLISITLIFAVIGGLYSFFNTFVFGEYGNTVSFHVSSLESTEDLIHLLRSESFAEKLLLDENGLPPREKCNPEDYDAALNSIIECNRIRQNLKDITSETTAFSRNIVLPDGTKSTWDNVVAERDRLQGRCDEIVQLLTVYKSAYSDAVAQDPNHILRTAEYEKELESAQAEKKEFDETVYLKALAQKRSLEQKHSSEYSLLKQKKEISEELCAKVIGPWRNDSQVKKDITFINNSITVEYTNESKEKDEVKNNTSFINVEVSVKGDKERADRIIKSLGTALPIFVEQSMEELTESTDTKCSLISPFSEAKNLNAKDFWENSFKKALLFALCAFAAYSLLVMTKGYIRSVLDESNGNDN